MTQCAETQWFPSKYLYRGLCISFEGEDFPFEQHKPFKKNNKAITINKNM